MVEVVAVDEIVVVVCGVDEVDLEIEDDNCSFPKARGRF